MSKSQLVIAQSKIARLQALKNLTVHGSLIIR
ncbi:hypothetical protein DFP97_12219 [Paenibacillus prosopidis]|uniref:Uncharacterized protein n=1 Tax=Paenibacillus prosopidis TaxID=630520 RepID=A0A368VJ54_9BACL|nr:hypothetical protein DFP97_12219 [Paenibacillus prosopidis]